MTAPVLRRPDDLPPTAATATTVPAAASLAQVLGPGLDQVVQQLAATAVRRDREGGHAAESAS